MSAKFEKWGKASGIYRRLNSKKEFVPYAWIPASVAGGKPTYRRLSATTITKASEERRGIIERLKVKTVKKGNMSFDEWKEEYLELKMLQGLRSLDRIKLSVNHLSEYFGGGWG